MPALAAWTIAGSNRDARAATLASAIAGLLGERDAWPVWQKDIGERPARGGDIAILCRGNDQVAALASALDTRGVRVAVERRGLLDQPEVEVVLAALRWVADPSDLLAAAELVRLAGDGCDWIEAAFAAESGAALQAAIVFADDLIALRDRTPHLTPAEMLDAVLHVPGLLAVVRRWSVIEARLANLEALRALADKYQDDQRADRRAATISGLCAWLTSQKDAA
jgi:ATP-dependent helicase/nuclease subunit A